MDLKKNNLDFDYQSLLHDIMSNGVEKETRNGTTISVFGRQIRHNMSNGFPLLTTKKMAWKQIVIELLWFLKGQTNIQYLHTPHADVDCNIWDGDAYKNYCQYVKEEWESGAINELWEEGLIVEESNDEKNINYRLFTKEEFIDKIRFTNDFSKKWGELGPIYGAQWRNWSNVPGEENKGGTDQIANLISELKTNPDSRRLMVSAWNVGELDQMVLPPCHYGFQVYTRELRLIERIDIAIEKGLTTKTSHLSEEDYWKWCDKRNIPTRAISLMWNQRSVDTFLGLPFNIASYGLLLCILAEMTNMIPDELIGNLGDVHLYKNHTMQAIQQISRKPYSLPNLRINTEFWNPENILGDDYGSIIEGLEMNDFQIEGYQSHPTIKAPLSN